MIYGPQEITVYIYLHLVPFAPSLSPAAAMSKARALKKSDSHASDAEAVVDLELLKQASSRVADADALAKGDAVYDFAEENLKGFHSLFTQEFEEQARLASHVHLTWASGCSGSEGAFYVMEAVSRAYSLCSGTCALKVSLKHTFSCEAQADKQRWIQAVLDCGPLKNMDGGADSSESSDAADSKGCLFNDIQTLGETHAECITHGQKCKVPRCDIFVIGSSCKDLSKANPKKETQKLVFHEATSLGGSAQTYQGFTSYVKAHSPGIVVYENVDGLEETIGASAQSNLDILMGTMKALGYKGQPLRTDAAAFGLPARRRRLYVLFVRQVNPKFNTQTRSLTKSFDMFGSLVASCLRSPPCAKELLLDSTSTEVNEFLEERKRHRAAQASKTQKSASSWTDQHMKFAEAEGLRWGQPHPESLKVNEWFQTLTAREQDLLVLSRAQAPEAGFRNLSQSIGREYSMSFCKETKKHVAPTMLPGQLFFLDLLKPPRLMLGQEALLFQGFPALGFLSSVEEEGVNVFEELEERDVGSKKRKRLGQPRKWLTENLMSDLAGNAMALPVLLAIVQSAVASLLFRPGSDTASAEQTADALSALGVLSGFEINGGLNPGSSGP